MNTPLISSYAKMIEKHLCTLDQLPAEYIDDVAEFMKGDPITSAEETPEVVEEPSVRTLHGALYIPKIEDFKIDYKSFYDARKTICHIDNIMIFTPEIIGDNEVPTDVEYDVSIIESIFGKFDRCPDVIVANNGTGCELTILGRPRNNIEVGDNILRVDLKIKSSNYEPMRVTIYFTAK